MNAIRGKLSDHAAKGYSKIDAYEHDLHQIYLRARNRIETELSNFMQRRGASFTGPRLVSLFDDLNEMFPEFEEEYRETYEHALEYMAHQNYAAALLDMGLEKSVVGTMDKSLFENMRQDGFQHIAGATRNMQAEVIFNLRKMSAQVMREAALTGMTRQEVSRRLAFENGYGVGSYFQQEGRRGSDFQFIDAGGRRWKTEKYFNMLGRTLLHNNARECYLAGCAKAGSDIVTISVSGDCCDACGKYENALLSISGATPGLPTLEEAMAEGLFHPNCTHRIIAVPESIAKKYYGFEGKTKSTREKEQAEQPKTEKSELKQYKSADKNDHGGKPRDSIRLFDVIIDRLFGNNDSNKQIPEPAFDIQGMRGIAEQTRLLIGNRNVNLEGITNEALANQMNFALHHILQKYPQIFLTGVETDRNLADNEPMAMTPFNTLLINPKYFNGLIEFMNKHKVQNGKYVIPGTAAMYKGREVETLVFHECGHALCNYWGIRNPQSEIAKQKKILLKKLFSMAKADGFANSISDYAARSEQEFFSEVFAAMELDKREFPDYIKTGIAELMK